MTDGLFGNTDRPGDPMARYPDAPGRQDRDTSADAAEEMRGKASTLRAQAYALLRTRSMTADEIAERLGESILAIRPRVTELNRQGLIHDSGERRRNRSLKTGELGKKAIVWMRS